MSKKSDIAKFVSNKIRLLQAMSETGNGKAELAELRKGVGKVPGEFPVLYGVILEDMPEDFFSNNGVPTKEEWACYVALTLFAWHQQGNDLKTDCMHTDEKVSLGTALRRLKNVSEDSNAEERILKKMQAVITATEIKGVEQHIRSLTRIFSNNRIKLNYALLAADLYEWQFLESRNIVGLRWGQDFYRISKEEEKK